jgi:hypothetical protein
MEKYVFFKGGNFQVGFSHVSIGLEVEKWALPIWLYFYQNLGQV